VACCLLPQALFWDEIKMVKEQAAAAVKVTPDLPRLLFLTALVVSARLLLGPPVLIAMSIKQAYEEKKKLREAGHSSSRSGYADSGPAHFAVASRPSRKRSVQQFALLICCLVGFLIIRRHSSSSSGSSSAHHRGGSTSSGSSSAHSTSGGHGSSRSGAGAAPMDIDHSRTPLAGSKEESKAMDTAFSP
jgi:hypothetical protein